MNYYEFSDQMIRKCLSKETYTKENIHIFSEISIGEYANLCENTNW